MTTDTLIERLARELRPVQPLPHPGVRAAMWVGGAAFWLAVIAVPLTSRADIAANSAGGVWFLLAQLLAIVTGIVAAAAAFASVVPGYSRSAAMGTAAAAAAWMASLAVGAWRQWSDPVDPSLPSEWVCVVLIVASGAPLMLVFSRMLRRGAVFHPVLTATLAAVAVTLLANAAACMTHPHTNNAVTFVWHGLLLLAVATVSAIAGPRLLR
jgi:hypothetical protein